MNENVRYFNEECVNLYKIITICYMVRRNVMFTRRVLTRVGYSCRRLSMCGLGKAFMRLYIIRHAQSVNNALMEDQEKRVQDPPLTDIGHQQTAHLAEYFKLSENLETRVTLSMDDPARNTYHPYEITHLYCSPMHRALQTARPIGEALNLTPEVWIDIHEHGGIWLQKEGVITGYGGMTRSQILAEFPGYVLPEEITEAGWWKPEDGLEDISLCHARAMRVAAALKSRAIDEASKDDQVAIVVHGTFIDSLLKALFDRLPSNHYYHWHYNTAVTQVDFVRPDFILLRYVNRVTHLPPHLVT